MAQFGKLSGTITDAQGNPVSGATVEVRRQGAFVTSTQAGPIYTVNDPGGIVSADQVKVNALSTPTRNVSAVAATTVTTGGPGLGTLNNNDRITPYSPLPTLYADAQGAETKANPLTTDASGFWYCWVEIRPYDIIETYGSTVRIKTDLVPEGLENVLSNIFSGIGIVAWYRNTVRTLTAGNLWQVDNNGADKAALDFAGNLTLAGNLTAVNGTFSGTLGVTGNVSMTGDLTVDDITADDISIGDLTVSGAVSLPAGSIETADLATNAVVVTRTADGTADQTFVAGAYATGNYVDVTGATITFTPASTGSEIIVMAHCPSDAAGAASLNSWMAIRDGSGNILHQSEESTLSSGHTNGPTLLYRVTGLSGSQTFKVSGQCEVANMVVNNSSWAAARRTRIIVMEFKK